MLGHHAGFFYRVEMTPQTGKQHLRQLEINQFTCRFADAGMVPEAWQLEDYVGLVESIMAQILVDLVFALINRSWLQFTVLF